MSFSTIILISLAVMAFTFVVSEWIAEGGLLSTRKRSEDQRDDTTEGDR